MLPNRKFPSNLKYDKPEFLTPSGVISNTPHNKFVIFNSISNNKIFVKVFVSAYPDDFPEQLFQKIENVLVEKPWIVFKKHGISVTLLYVDVSEQDTFFITSIINGVIETFRDDIPSPFCGITVARTEKEYEIMLGRVYALF